MKNQIERIPFFNDNHKNNRKPVAQLKNKCIFNRKKTEGTFFTAQKIFDQIKNAAKCDLWT